MQFYKIVGASLLIIGGVTSTYFLNNSAGRAVAQIDAFCALLRYIRGQVECFALPIGEILGGCDEKILSDCGWQRNSAPQSLDELIVGCEFYDSPTEKAIREFSGRFGRSYREESVKECDYYIAVLLEREQTLASELPKKKKLNATLCISGALALVILFV